MKILSLRLAGFGPYKKEEFVNFEQFDDDGIFLISGKTGAGKSSILDAICFALYNQVPRFDGGELRLRSDHCEPGDPTFVELDFSINEVRYRLRRSPAYERPKKNGAGTTTAIPSAVLQVHDSDGWRGIAAKLVTVGHELDAILPLKVDQFLQVILLAQNRFQRFLLAKTEERRMVLRTLFNTGRFDQLEAALILRRKALQEQVSLFQRSLSESQVAVELLLHYGTAATGDDADALSPPSLASVASVASAASKAPTAQWFAAAQRTIRSDRDAASAGVALCDANLAAATSQHDACVLTHQSQLRRSRTRIELATLEAAAAQIAGNRAELKAADRAATIWPYISALGQALLAKDKAETTLASARAEHGVMLAAQDQLTATDLPVSDDSSGPRAGTDTKRHRCSGLESLQQLEGEGDRLLGLIGALADALAEELTLPALLEQIAALSAVRGERNVAFESLRERVAALPEQIEALTVEHSNTRVIAQRLADTTTALDHATRAVEAARAVEQLGTALRAAQASEVAASGDNVAAAARYDILLAQRFSGFASELATRLVAGKACSVCGSTSHPQPASKETEPVTSQDVNTARAAVAERQGALAAAQLAVQSVDRSLAEAQARAGDGDLAHHLANQNAATEAQKQASDAGALLPALEEQLATLRADLAGHTSKLEAVRNDRDSAVAEHATRVDRRVILLERLAIQRGAFTSVHERATKLRANLRVTRAVITALQAHDQRQREHETCRLSLKEQLAAEGFDTITAAESARIAPVDIDRRVQALRQHDDALAAARATLADPELTGLPEHLVDREPTALAAEAAGARRDEALTRYSSLVDRSASLDDIVHRVTTLLVESGSLHTSFQQVRELADVVHGDEPNTKRMRLENYVLAAQLEQIVQAANVRLGTMTSGRYALEHDDSVAFGGARSGLGLVIRDEYTGRARATHSLSGGETFLASLALALGLAEVVTAQAGGITLDTLFVDEGFGSLDGETLETAMSTLDSLRAGGRTIGLISHVDSMKEQIPATLHIAVTEQGFSRILSSDSVAP